jgi:hypothetical protein
LEGNAGIWRDVILTWIYGEDVAERGILIWTKSQKTFWLLGQIALPKSGFSNGASQTHAVGLRRAGAHLSR